MRDIAVRFGAKEINIFVILNRLRKELLKGIVDVPGKKILINIFYLFDYYIEAFNKTSCPICLKIKNLSKKKKKINSNRALSQLDSLIKNLEPHEIINPKIPKNRETYGINNLAYTKLLNLFYENPSAFLAQLNNTASTQNICLMIKILSTSPFHEYTGSENNNILRICESIIDGTIGCDNISHSIELITKIKPSRLVNNLSKIVNFLPENDSIYFCLLNSLYETMELHGDLSNDIGQTLRNIWNDVESKLMDERVVGDEYGYYWSLDGILYELRQDLWEVLPPNTKETFAKTLLCLLDHHSFHRGANHRELGKFFNNFLHNIELLISQPKKENIDLLTKKLQQWNSIIQQMKIMQVAAKRMYNSTDVLPILYFTERESSDCFYGDLLKIDDWVTEFLNIKAPSMYKSDYFEECLKVLFKINKLIFNSNAQFVKDLKTFTVNIVPFLEQTIQEEAQSCEISNITVHFNKNKLPATRLVLFGIKDMRLLFSNLFSNALVKAFKHPNFRQKNEIHFYLEDDVVDNCVTLIYSDNGSGMSKDQTIDILKNRDHQWGRSYHKIRRFGGGVDINSDMGKGTEIKIKLIGVE